MTHQACYDIAQVAYEKAMNKFMEVSHEMSEAKECVEAEAIRDAKLAVYRAAMDAIPEYKEMIQLSNLRDIALKTLHESLQIDKGQKMTEINPKYLIVDDRLIDRHTNEVAVLSTSEFGSGWSTMNRDDCLFTPVVALWVLGGKIEDERPDFAKLYGEYFYGEGAKNLSVSWMTKGTKFIVDNYDGIESFIILTETQWRTA